LILAAESYETLGYSYLFLVNAAFDLNHDRLIVVVGYMVHRLLHGLEITRPIRRHNNPHRTSISHKKAQKAQKYCWPNQSHFCASCSQGWFPK